jgi:hypothetical protein
VIELVDKINPRHVAMETFHSHLPPAAMEKYRAIERIFSLLGYNQSTWRDGTDGKDYWLFYLD